MTELTRICRRGEFHREAPAQAEHPGLGGGVVGVLAPAVHAARDGGHGDHRAGTVDAGGRGAQGAQDAGQVDLQHVVPGRVGELRERGPAQHSGVGHGDVEAAPLVDRALGERLDLRGVPYVHLVHHAGTAGPLHLPEGLGGVVRVAGEGADDRTDAAGGVRDGQRAADPAGSAGDDGDPPVSAER